MSAQFQGLPSAPPQPRAHLLTLQQGEVFGSLGSEVSHHSQRLPQVSILPVRSQHLLQPTTPCWAQGLVHLGQVLALQSLTGELWLGGSCSGQTTMGPY